MKKLALLLALFPGSLLAQNTPDWWVGIWAWDSAWCAAKDNIGSVTPAPILITKDEIRGYENSCAITMTREITETSVYVGMICSGEGETYQEDRLIMRGDNSIWMWYGSGEPTQFQHCN